MSKREEQDGVIPSLETAPRRRVMDLVRRMAKATALGGAAVGLAAAESCSPLVCDPLPPPITCANPTRAELQNAMSFTARWVAGDAGALEVHLTVSYFGRQTVTFARAVTATNATVKSVSTTATALDADLSPAAGATTVTVALTFDCAGTTDAMTLSLNVSGTPQAGNPVTVTITSP